MNGISSNERAEATRRSRLGLFTWLAALFLAVGFVVWHARSVDRYLDRVSDTRFAHGVPDTPLRRVPQAIASDGQVWIRHTLNMVESGEWRLRSTVIDNAPDGRPVYWNSGWAWWLAACAHVRMAVTNEPLASALEAASPWAYLPVFVLVVTAASGWVWRRWGGAAGALMALGLAGHRKFYEGFYPAYCDHHGLINTAVLGVILGAVFAGAGWWKRTPESGRTLLPGSEAEVMRAATVSAICGAAGMWVSAASLVITIGFTGAAILVVGVLCIRKTDSDFVCVPRAWQRWGRVGGGLCLAFYLLESFPNRWALRLEANHPLYAVAWWAAGEGMALLLGWRTGSVSKKGLGARLCGWAAVVALAPTVVWMRGADVFTPVDPFLGRIHASIHEFEPLWTAIAREGWRPYLDQLLILVVLTTSVAVWLRRSPGLSQRVLIGFAGFVALVTTALGCWQGRWLLTASAAQVCLSVALLLALTGHWRCRWRAMALGGVALLLYVPGTATLVQERRLVERVRDVQMGETVQLLYRDVAAALLAQGADPSSIILASPNASVGVGYYGRLRSVGTLYWENRDGLLAAAEIFGARDDAEAAARVHARGITHVVMFSSYDFLREYEYALRGDDAVLDEGIGFGHRLLYEHRVPTWLRPLNYQVPAPLVPLGFKVALFAVDFEAPVAIAHERIGLHQLTNGRRDLAEISFMASLTADASRSEPWLLQGSILLATGRTEEAFVFIRAGILRTPYPERRDLIKTAAGLFSRLGETGRAQADALLQLNADTPPAE